MQATVLITPRQHLSTKELAEHFLSLLGHHAHGVDQHVQDPCTLTFGDLLLPLHLPAVLLQLSVGKRVEGVGARGAHNDMGLVLFLNDGLGGCH